MKRVFWNSITVLTLAASVAYAQGVSTSASSSTQVSAQGGRKGANANASNTTAANAQTGSAPIELGSGSTMEARLTKSLDAAKAKPGDPVEAKVENDIKVDGKVVVPKGTTLIGHVTEAKPHTKAAKGEAAESSSSRLGIDFDKAILKGGREAPLNVTVQAVAAAESAVQPSAGGGDIFAGGGAGGGVGGAGGGGGGLLGGVRSGGGSTLGGGAGILGGAGQSLGGALNSTTSAAGSVGGGSLIGGLSSNSAGVIGLQGMNLTSEVAGSAQGSLISSPDRTVKLDSGTRFLLRGQAR